ncbi:MAG: hypothetical protein INR67_16640 [Jatrophihabitans endophyticus]|nr:hypothetical protein [Jatrophihabitans endophyticus]
MKTSPNPTFVPRSLRLLCAAALPLLALPPASAQTPGDQDPTFAVGPDANGFVRAVAVQGDDQTLVGGEFTTFQGQSRNALARVHTDGTLDAFNPGLAISGYSSDGPRVEAVAVQPDGKILAAGSFTVLNQTAGGGVVRLNADGSLDTGFNVGSGVVDDGGEVGVAYALKVLPNGQILVGGAFQSFNGVAVAGLVRLNADGSLDPAYNAGGAGVAANPYGQDVRAIALQDDGRVLVGGHFSAYDGQAANCVARLQGDGTLDPSFNVGTGPDYGVLSLAVQGDGKILVGGGYSSFDGNNNVEPLLRVNADGSLDTGFYPTGNVKINEADAVLAQPDGTILVGGLVYTTGGLIASPVNGVVRYLGDGTQDGGFDVGSDGRQVLALALQSDGRAVAVSGPTNLVGNPSGNVYRYYDLVLPTFFTGEVYLGSGVYYLAFPNGNYFGYYAFLSDPHYIYHFDLGYEYVFDANDGYSGVYFYDFKSDTFFYTSPTFGFPYLYDFTLNSVLFYYPDPNNAGHYNTNGVRYFYDFATGQIITK